MRLLIAYTNPFSYSETFIHNHIKYLHPTETLTNGWMPFQDSHKKSIFNGLFAIDLLRGFVRKYFQKIYFTQYTAALKKFLIKNKIEVVLAEYGITSVNISIACNELNIPFVAHFHGFDAYEYKTIQKYHDEYLLMSTTAKKIVVVSEDMKQALINLGIDSKKIINNPYGVELEKYQQAFPEKNKNIIISVGRFTAKKAPQLVIRSFFEVKKHIQDAELWMIGGGELLEECKLLINELGLNDSIKLLGVKTPNEISTYLKQARIFVQHSLRPITGDSEGTPNTVLEASATGLPIVSTKHAGIKEAVIHGQTGYLVDEGDYQKMASILIDLIHDDERVKVLGANARLHVEKNYNIVNRINALKEIIEND